MAQRELWFERRFVFDLPPSRFAGTVERLRGTPMRLEERTRGLERATLVRHDPQKWSIQEQVGHLLDLEPLWFRRTEQLFAGEGELVAADLTNRKTDEAGHNARPLTELLDEFRDARGRLLDLLNRADDATIVRAARHPRLQQPLRLIDHALFVAEHDDHHLAGITELRQRWG